MNAKERIVDEIIDDIRSNFAESEDFILDMAKIGLRTKSMAFLKSYFNGRDQE